ncbi:hypothetical protein CAPTEDRAFT_218758 [Capitella teleta]|uniref:Cadherin domain-containing protein n=1 Tax=Capitella teleta TaxID=283909 RepID=R7UFF6_CAPTE|nr:hypothetical protein CAPTEDRAFT_218758 [Capitella teleta]|eukprot:ELU04950.1 hypothetical protein CAPTEDRAFT_218758 [Capitella teleta]
MEMGMRLAFLLPWLLVSTTFAQVQNQVGYRLQEERPTSTFIGHVGQDSGLEAEHPGVFSQLQFSIMSQSSQFTDLFRVSTEGGLLTTTSRIDREEYCPGMESCSLEFNVQVMPLEYFYIIKIKIELTDINDNTPEFPMPVVRRSISEASVLGSRIRLDPAVDLDSPQYSVQRYSLEDQTKTFGVSWQASSSREVGLVLNKYLDHEKTQSYSLILMAHDGSTNTASVSIEITVLDLNDNAPVFDQREYFFRVEESVPLGHVVGRILATDTDSGENGRVVYDLQDPVSPFKVNSTSGIITVSGLLDREATESYSLTVLASDLGANSVQVPVTVTVTIIDLNDNIPQISVRGVSSTSPTGRVSIMENSPIGTFLAHISVKDSDSGLNGDVTCNLLNNTHFQMSAIFKDEYKVLTRRAIDHEEQSTYEIHLRCSDQASTLRLTAESVITVDVLDENDNSPVFSRSLYNVTVLENTPKSRFLLRVSATDRDSGENGQVRYSIEAGARMNFTIHPTTGVISSLVKLDYEINTEYTFAVIATDQNRDARRSSTALVIINIVDVDDEDPIFVLKSYDFFVPEDSTPNSHVGNVVAIDADSYLYNKFQYTIRPLGGSLTGVFGVITQTGEIVTLAELDREAQDTYRFVVTATSTGLREAEDDTVVTIHVVDVNDHTPVITFPTESNNTVYISNQMPKSSVICTVTAFDLDLPQLSFHLFGDQSSENYFAINESSGLVSTLKDMEDISHSVFRLNVLVRDGGSPPKTTQSALHIIVNQSIPYHVDVTSGRPSNHLIVIAIACSSGVVMVILVVAIAAILNQQRRNYKQSGSFLVIESRRSVDTDDLPLKTSTPLQKKNPVPDVIQANGGYPNPDDIYAKPNKGLVYGVLMCQNYTGLRFPRELAIWAVFVGGVSSEHCGPVQGELIMLPKEIKELLLPKAFEVSGLITFDVRHSQPSLPRPMKEVTPSPPPPPKPPRTYSGWTSSDSPAKGQFVTLPAMQKYNAPNELQVTWLGDHHSSDELQPKALPPLPNSPTFSNDVMITSETSGHSDGSDVTDSSLSRRPVSSYTPKYSADSYPRRSNKRPNSSVHFDDSVNLPWARDVSVIGSHGNRESDRSDNHRNCVILEGVDDNVPQASYV